MKIFEMATTGVLSLAFAMALFTANGNCDVVGSTYSLGATVFTADTDGDGFLDAGFFAEDGPAGLTFDGTTKTFGNLVFGNAGDTLEIQESLVVTGDTFTVTVFAVGRDASNNLTTWAADGTTIDHDSDILTPEIPLAFAGFAIGEGNGGTDALEVNTGGATYAFVESEALLVTFDETDLAAGPTVLTFGAGPTDGGATGEFTGTVLFNGSPDISGPATSLGGFGNLSIAGFGYSYTYTLTTAIPEPSSAAGLALLGLGFIGRRRRN